MPWASTTLGTLGSVLNQISKALPGFELLPKVADGLQVDGYVQQLRQLEATKPDQLNELLFDVIFVDEAQDFEPKEFRVLMELTRVHPKSGLRPLILFYDDAQNIVGKRRPNW